LPEPTVQATFNMPPELYERLKAQAATEGTSMREIMENALKSYFAQAENGSQERGA
jgi:predicted DNA-binding protein